MKSNAPNLVLPQVTNQTYIVTNSYNMINIQSLSILVIITRKTLMSSLWPHEIHSCQDTFQILPVISIPKFKNLGNDGSIDD
jgi:hypothetical protein